MNIPGKGWKIQLRPRTAFFDSEGETGLGNNGSIPTTGEQVDIHEEPAVTLQVIKHIFAHEVGKLEIGFKQFREDMCKAINSLEQRFDAKLSDVVWKIKALQSGQRISVQQVEKIKAQVSIRQ